MTNWCHPVAPALARVWARARLSHRDGLATERAGDLNPDLMNDANFLLTSDVRIPHPYAPANPKVSG